MYSNTARCESARVRQAPSWASSTLSVAKKLSATALSQQRPTPLMLRSMPCPVRTARYDVCPAPDVPLVDPVRDCGPARRLEAVRRQTGPSDDHVGGL